MNDLMPRRIGAGAIAVAILVALLVTTPPPAESQLPPDFRALLFTRTEAFRHTSIDEAVQAFDEMAATNNFAVETTEDPAAFTDANLARFDVVVFLLTTGDVLGPAGQKAFRRYIESGGAYMGVHSASDTEYDWPFYGRLVGAYFESHARFRPGRVLVPDRVHPSTADLPLRWGRTDEWYNFATNPRGKVHVLATVDETSYEGKKMGPDHPISWCRTLGGSRSWYTGLGHTDASYTEPEFRSHLLGGIRWAAGAVSGDCTGTVWKNLQKVSLDRDTDDPMELAVAPDSRVFFVERLGKIKMYDPATQTTEVIGNLDVFSGNEDGLLGIALDPNFVVTRWVYLFYSPAGNRSIQRVSRFTLGLTGLDISSERVLLEIPTQRKQCCHSAGSLAFGENGNLYISTGDNTNPFAAGGYSPLDERPKRKKFDAQATAGNTNDLRGKILRIHPEPDGSYTVPAGNLFPPGTADTEPEIYVMGLRNPFRIHVDLTSGRLVWGDLGPDARVGDRERGPKGFDEFNIATSPGNYGWPFCIADNRPYRHYDYASGNRRESFDCERGPVNASPNNTGLAKTPPAVASTIHYPYGKSSRFPLMGSGGGRAGFAGPVFRLGPGAGVEGLPAYYNGALFALEWARRFIREVRLDPQGRLLAIAPFMSNTTFRRPMDMALGPDGSLYLLEWGSTRIRGNTDSGLYRIVATEPGERYPTARASSDRISGNVPLTVHFEGSRSSDPDRGQQLSYAWDFDSDGSVDSTMADPTHEYTEVRNYRARLVVTDPTGKRSATAVRITAGNRRPKISFRAPPEGGFFDWGDRFRAKVRIADPEDGSTADGGIDCSDVTLQGLLGHNAHTHPLDQRSACISTFKTLGGGAHGNSSADLFFAIQASYRDRGNGDADPLTARKIRELQPRSREAEHFDDRFGARPARDGRVIRMRRSGAWLALRPVNLLRTNGVKVRVRAVTRPADVTVRKGGPNGRVLGSLHLDPSTGFATRKIALADARGTFSLYVVVSAASGPNFRGRLLDMDRVRFVGRGIAIRK